MALPAPYTPPPPIFTSNAATLNARFHRAPFGASAHYPSDGAMPAAGVLIHITDGWEEGGAAWQPSAGTPFMSASLIYAAQVANRERIPTFNWQTRGTVLRPEYARVLCGCDGDCGGKCIGAYGSPDPRPRYCNVTHPPNGWTGCVWPAGEGLAVLFERCKANRLYNEVILDGGFWRTHMPEAVEAILGDAGLHRAFVRQYGLSPDRVPLLQLDLQNWHRPFR